MSYDLKYEDPISITRVITSKDGRIYIPKKVLKESNLLYASTNVMSCTNCIINPDIHIVDECLKTIDGWNLIDVKDIKKDQRLRLNVKHLFRAKPGDEFVVEAYKGELTIYKD